MISKCTATTPNRSLYSYDVQMDVCATTTPNRCLYDSRQTFVALRFKGQSDSCYNLHRDEKKKWQTYKNPILVC